MKPYYQDDLVTIYHGDALDILPRLSPVDVVITDPPYNVGIEYGGSVDDERRDDAYEEWCGLWFAELRRLAPAVALTPGIANVGKWGRIAGDPNWILAWLKPAAMGRCIFGFTNWEPVLFYGKSPTSRGVDVFTAPIVSDDRLVGHPCPKPLKWGLSLVSLLAPSSDAVILDPFAGSGTVLRAAKDHGRRSIGIEIEERYCALAVERVAQDVLWSEAA